MFARTWSLCWHCFKDITWETRKYTIYFSPNDLEWISVIEVKSAVFEDYMKMIHCFLSTKEGSTGFIKKIYRYSIFINVRKFPHLILKKFQTFSKLFIQHHIYIYNMFYIILFWIIQPPTPSSDYKWSTTLSLTNLCRVRIEMIVG